MKTRSPLILTAKISEPDIATFDHLRKKHFPADRNFLRAHLTMFHRLPGEYVIKSTEIIAISTQYQEDFMANISGVRHMGAGVAYDVQSDVLHSIRSRLRDQFATWLGPQDKQKWQPHITVQNKAQKTDADRLHKQLSDAFQPSTINVIGLDLWRYLNGPWEQVTSIAFMPAPQSIDPDL